jgi:hypothetical protein
LKIDTSLVGPLLTGVFGVTSGVYFFTNLLDGFFTTKVFTASQGDQANIVEFLVFLAVIVYLDTSRKLDTKLDNLTTKLDDLTSSFKMTFSTKDDLDRIIAMMGPRAPGNRGGNATTT